MRTVLMLRFSPNKVLISSTPVHLWLMNKSVSNLGISAPWRNFIFYCEISLVGLIMNAIIMMPLIFHNYEYLKLVKTPVKIFLTRKSADNGISTSSPMNDWSGHRTNVDAHYNVTLRSRLEKKRATMMQIKNVTPIISSILCCFPEFLWILH